MANKEYHLRFRVITKPDGPCGPEKPEEMEEYFPADNATDAVRIATNLWARISAMWGPHRVYFISLGIPPDVLDWWPYRAFYEDAAVQA
jgi:hypothetical protein